jgi:hypothetical protein
MRDRHDLARTVGLLLGAGVRETRLLLYRQRVHVRADEHGGAVAVLENADDAGRADLVMHLVSRLAQRIHGQRGRVLLLI